MKKNLMFLSIVLVMLLGLSQGAWADASALPDYMAYFAKAKVQVGSKSNGMGTVYIGPAVQFAGAEDATSYDGTKTMSDERPFGFSQDGVPYIKAGYDLSTPAGMMAMSPWFAPAGEDVKVFREIDFTGAGSALPVYAAYMAQPNQGYYFKGWSTIDNDASLGNQNPFAYPIQSQAMPLSAPVNEVMVYLNGEKMPMGYYVAEGNSNRYLFAQKTVYNDRFVYQCFKDGNDYALFDMSQDNSGVYLYIPQRDNVNQRIYVIDDDGTRVDQIDGGYLPVPSVSDASYIIMKNPYNGQFFTLHYDPTAVANCLNVENYPEQDYMYDLEDVPSEEWEGIITQRITDTIMECAANVLLSGQGSERLLVSFQRATYTIDGQEVPASAVVQARDERDNLIYKAIQFLPDESTLPRIPTMYATFAPVQINSCTSQNVKTWSEENESEGKISFDVTFSTSYASKIEDFGEVTFDKQPTLGGTYSAEVTGFDSETGVVTVSVTFTGTGLADGEYKSSMTLLSYGGESYVSCLVNVRKGAEANKAVTIGDNKYDDLASALAAANVGDELVVLTNLTEAATIAKNITFNLDGWTLTGNVTVNSVLTLKNGAIKGAVSVAQTGDLTVDGANINGTLTNNGTASIKRGVIDGGMAKSIVNKGMLTLEKGAEIIAENNIGVDMTAGSDGVVNGAKFRGTRPINLAEGANGNFNSAYFNYEFDFSSWGLTHYNVTVGAAYEAGYTHLYAKDLAAAQAAGAPVCKIGQTGYSSLEDALLYAQNNPSEQVTIIMTNDYTLKAGYYTLPANANLLIPYWEGQASIMGGSPQKLAIGEHYEDPEAFCTLTFANGVHMSVAGNIEASCRQFIAGHGSQGNAVPSGNYGWLKLEAGSDITLGNGSHLYAWGFVTGDGEIDARRGASVHEMFQVYDWPGANGALNMVLESLSGAGAFPINQYFMQNVESQTTFHPGARMFCSFGASAAGLQVAADAIQIVGIYGDIAMFLMDPNADQDNTWVRKRYDQENDIQVWEVNSGANLGSMVIEVPVFKIAAQMMPQFAPLAAGGFDSRNFILPITTNMKIHLLSGKMGITQNTELLPGAEIEVNKESTVTIFPSTDASSGFLYLFDSEDWVDGFSCDKPAQQIRYSPTFGGAPNIREIDDKDDLEDAKLNIHGTLAVEGLLMTTEKGANIFSTNEDAGTIVYPNKVSFKVVMVDEENKTTQVVESPQLPIAALPNQLFAEGAGFPIPHWDSNENKTVRTYAGTAMLRNGVGEDAPSGGVTTNAESLASLMEDPANWEPQTGDNFTMPDESFCYIRDRWTKMKQFDERFAYNNYNEWYIKPAEYVAVATTAKDVAGDYKDASTSTQPLENPDHTYSDAAGEGRLFIWVESPSDGAPGQWWEVTLEDNLYKGMNGTFYEYNEEYELWVEHTFEITFLNWDGEPVLDHNDEATVYTLHYGDRIQYLGTNPTREENVDYTYNFTGWSPAITADTKVTGDATYTATYEAIQRKYTVIFLNENGTEIERHFLTRDEMPVCEALPSKTGYYLQWTPAIGAVTGDQEYRATFTPEKPTSFMITFKNYDGTELQSDMVNVGETPACAEPTKPATSEYSYAFAGWNPVIEPVSQEMTYTALFNEVANTYAIRFFDEKHVQIGATQNLAYGVAPSMPNYVKAADAEYTYATTWTPQVAAVTKAQDYTAVITPTKNKYTVTINATGCAVNGAGSYDYGTEVTLSLGAALEGFENPEWGELPQGYSIVDNKISFTITENVTFAASASIKATATEINLSGSNKTQTYVLSADTKIASLTIEAGGSATAQIIGAEHIEMLAGGRAYYKYNFNAAAGKWYTFGVPFKVNGDQAVGTKTLVREKDYRIVHYNGALRAINGADRSAWEITGGTLVPGELYMIKFLTNQSAVTFTGTANHNYDYSASASVVEYPASDPLNAGWNGIANPALYFAQLGIDGVNEAQVYNPETDGYATVENISTISVPVGMAAFVQVPASQSIVVDVPSAPVAARRATKEDVDRYVVTLSQNDIQTDKVILRSSEDAEDRYVIGEDLAKAGVSSTVGQMWVNRYGAKLCVNNAAPISGETTYPLSISAPKNGQYTITLTDTMDDMEVVLMENAIPVAILSGAYDLTLAKGTTNDYSIVVRKAPRVTTGMESVADSDAVQKVLVGGKLYILMDGRVYDAMGRLVK